MAFVSRNELRKSAGARAFLAILSVFAVLSLSFVFPVSAGASLVKTGQLEDALEEVDDLVTADEDDPGTVQVVLSLAAVDELLEIVEFRRIVKNVDEISDGLANVLISTKQVHWENMAEALERQMPLPADLTAALAELQEALANPTTATTTPPVPATTAPPVPATTAPPVPTTTAAPIPATTLPVPAATTAPVPTTTTPPPPAITAAPPAPTTVPAPAATTVPAPIPEAQLTASENGGTSVNPPVTMSPLAAADSPIFSDLATTEGVEGPTLAPYDPQDGAITAVAGESAEATTGSILNTIADSAVLPWAAGTVLVLAAGLAGLTMQRSRSRRTPLAR